MADTTRVPNIEPSPEEPLEAEKSLPELLSRLTGDVGDLMSAQIELAKVEAREEIGQFGRSAGMLGGAAVAALLAVLLFSFAAAWGLAAVMPDGLAFAVVAGVWAVAAAVLYLMGRARMKEMDHAPATRQSMKEDVQWAKQQMS